MADVATVMYIRWWYVGIDGFAMRNIVEYQLDEFELRDLACNGDIFARRRHLR